MRERWADIPGFPDYQVSNLGRVISLPRLSNHGGYRPRKLKGKLLSSTRKEKYLAVTLWSGEKGRKFRVHQLVANAFLPPKPTPEHEVNHVNGDKTNCKITNLEWVTAKGNSQHAYSTGLNKRSANDATVLAVKDALYKAKASKPSLYGEVKRIAEEFGLTVWFVSNVNKGKTASYV